MKFKYLIFVFLIGFGCSSNKQLTEETASLTSTPKMINTPLEIAFFKSEAFNHPSFAIWVEDLEGNYIETLFVTRFVATGKFGHGEIEPGKWDKRPGVVRRPASLPYWAHKRGIAASDGLYIPSPETPVPDALTSATPTGNFVLLTGTKIKTEKFRVLLEINQPWDSNKFWTNNKFEGDNDYFASLQPALVYAVTINLDSNENEYYLNPIGHSHPTGKNGKLFTDISTLTTAKNIVGKIRVTLK